MSLQDTIEKKLTDGIQMLGLEVVNESYMHNVSPGSESHFKVVIISNDFIGQKLISRHQRVNNLLADELMGGIHALSIQAMTKEEWERKGKRAMPSPQCLGGGKSNQ